MPRPPLLATSLSFVPFVPLHRRRFQTKESGTLAAGPSPFNQPGVPSIRVVPTRTTRRLADSRPTRLLLVRDAACAVRAPRPSPSRPRTRCPVRAPRITRARAHTHTHTHTHTRTPHPPPRPTTRVTALNSCTLFYFRREKSPRHRRRSSGRGCSPSSSVPWPSPWASPPRREPRACL